MFGREGKLPGQRLSQPELEKRLMAVARPVLSDSGLPMVQYEIACNFVRELSRVLRKDIGERLASKVRALLPKYVSGGADLKVLLALVRVCYRALANQGEETGAE
ncbi:MAG: hypothetical protein NTX53_05575 [candidate division WOR-3 bacterium]|nr:hypothetical protein [candidate division WOR-3 bacterium]